MLVFDNFNQFKKYYNEDEKTFIFTEHGELADIEINFQIPPYLSKTINIVANNVSSSNTLIGKSIDCNNLDCPNLDFGHINCENITNVESIKCIKVIAKNINNVGIITCTRIFCENLNAYNLSFLNKAVLGVANVQTIEGIYTKSKNNPGLEFTKATISAEKIVCKSIDLANAESIGELYFEEYANIDIAAIDRKIEGEGILKSKSLWVGKSFSEINEDESETTTYTDVDYSEMNTEDEEVGLIKCPSIEVDNLVAKNVVVDYYNVKDADIDGKVVCTEKAEGGFIEADSITLNKGGNFNQITCNNLVSHSMLTVKQELSAENIKFDELHVNVMCANNVIGNCLKSGSVIADQIRVNNIEAKTLVAEIVKTNLETFKVDTCEAKFDKKNEKDDTKEFCS